MSNKKKPLAVYNRDMSPAEKELTRLRHKDLLRACIGRGMDFEYSVSCSIPQLGGWFIDNYERTQNLLLLNEFDDWRDLQLKMRTNTDGTRKYPEGDAVFHSALRLGFVGSKDDEGNTTSTKKPRLKGLKKNKKAQKERIEGTKVFAGTKKALTYQLTFLGEDFKSIWGKVEKQFPEAQEKSVKIWHKRALKEKK